MSSISSKSKQEEALKLLDDLDSFTPVSGDEASAPAGTTGAPAPSNESEAEALAFLDEIAQKSNEPAPRAIHLERPISRSGTPTLRKSTDRVRVGAPSGAGKQDTGTSLKVPGKKSPEPSPSQSGTSTQGGWGWGSVWSSASAAIQQARQTVDEQVKYLPQNEQAKKWREGVMEYAKSAQLDKLGQDFKRMGLSTLTDILNVVAPPISEHEVIQIWLTHDMKGYDGVESLVYQAMAKIMEQVQGGDLIVNRGNESRPKDSNSDERDLNVVDGYDAAVKLAQANIEELIKTNENPKTSQPSSTQTPTTYSHVYMRIQPYTTAIELPSQEPKAEDNASSATPSKRSLLHFLLYLSDPEHQLVQSTVTQAVPAQWLDLWDQYDWVEDLVAESLRVGVEVIGQEYVVDRMGWGKVTSEENIAPASSSNEAGKETSV